MSTDLNALVARAAILGEQIRALEDRLGPLRTELAAVNRKIAGVHLGCNSVAQRRLAVAERDHLICQEARGLSATQAYIPISWQQALAVKHGLSGRQVRRILKAADIEVSRWS